MEPIYIDAEIWGPSMWHTIEAISCTLHPNNKKSIRDFFCNLCDIIPCKTCREHYTNYFQSHPIDAYMENSLMLLKWIYNLRKEVKMRQEKDIHSFSEWIGYLNEKYDVPELEYYMEKVQEYKEIQAKLKIKSSPFLQKYHLDEF